MSTVPLLSVVLETSRTALTLQDVLGKPAAAEMGFADHQMFMRHLQGLQRPVKLVMSKMYPWVSGPGDEDTLRRFNAVIARLSVPAQPLALGVTAMRHLTQRFDPDGAGCPARAEIRAIVRLAAALEDVQTTAQGGEADAREGVDGFAAAAQTARAIGKVCRRDQELLNTLFRAAPGRWHPRMSNAQSGAASFAYVMEEITPMLMSIHQSLAELAR
jgi:hypothetical protein